MRTLYFCDGCKNHFESMHEAFLCEASHARLEPPFQDGEWLHFKSGFGSLVSDSARNCFLVGANCSLVYHSYNEKEPGWKVFIKSPYERFPLPIERFERATFEHLRDEYLDLLKICAPILNHAHGALMASGDFMFPEQAPDNLDNMSGLGQEKLKALIRATNGDIVHAKDELSRLESLKRTLELFLCGNLGNK